VTKGDQVIKSFCNRFHADGAEILNACFPNSVRALGTIMWRLSLDRRERVLALKDISLH